MLDLRIAEISSTSGTLSDGVARGSINQSQLAGAYSSFLQAAAIYALRKDSSTNNTFTDLSAQAVADTDNAFLPWGTDSEFSAGDEIWLANGDLNINEIYVQITTQGAWTGDGLEVLESTDGETLVAVQSLSDGTNGLRAAAGIYKISFAGNTSRKAIAPYFGATKRKYIILRPKNLTAKTVSPKLRMTWLADTTANEWINVTTILNGGMTDSNFGAVASGSIFPITGGVLALGFSGLTMGVDDSVFRGNPAVLTVAHEYLAGDDTWKPLQNYSDELNDIQIGSTLLATPRTGKRRWTIPADWAMKELTFPPSATSVSAYWVRMRTTAVSTYAPFSVSLARMRSKSFGTGLASGIYHKQTETYNYVTYTNGVASTTDTVVAITNAITGNSRSITIPANSLDSGTLASGRLDFSSDLTIGAGEQLLISHVSGTGRIQDSEFRIM